MGNRLWQAGKRLVVSLRMWRYKAAASGWQCLTFVVLLVPLVAVAEPLSETVYVAPPDHPRYKQVQRVLSEKLDGVRFRAWSSSASSKALVITLNQATLSEIRANRPDQPVLALFVLSQAVQSIVQNREDFSALYGDPPLFRQARLGQLLMPQAGTVAILASPQEAGQYTDLRTRLNDELGLASRVFVVPSRDQLIRHLARALSYGDFLLGTPDPAIFNRQTLKPLLLTSYRSNRLVIGPTRAFVNAGAVASTYTSARAQILEAGDMIRSWLDQGALGSARYPSRFDVTVNEQVARSLELPVPKEKELKKQLIRQEDGS
ncbi:hypothetical protein ACMDCT_02860 [Halomonadaceae bacterium KBTZ08]